MKTKSILASLAAAGVVLAQPAAAATRSYESVPAAGLTVADRADSIGADSEALRGKSILPIVLVFAILAALLALAGSGSNGPGRSPG